MLTGFYEHFTFHLLSKSNVFFSLPEGVWVSTTGQPIGRCIFSYHFRKCVVFQYVEKTGN